MRCRVQENADLLESHQMQTACVRECRARRASAASESDEQEVKAAWELHAQEEKQLARSLARAGFSLSLRQA